MMKISFSSSIPEQGVLCVGVPEDNRFTLYGQDLNKKIQGSLEKAVQATYFKGKIKENISLLSPAYTAFERIVLFGLGKVPLPEAAAYHVGGALSAHLQGTPHQESFVLCDEMDVETVVNIAFGALLRSWRFDKYRTKLKAEDKPPLQHLIFYTKEPEKAAELFKNFDAVAQGVFWSRNLIAEPGNVIYPETLAKEAEKLRSLGVQVEVFDHHKLASLGMNALLGVGCGSERPPYLVVMEWKGTQSDQKPVALVGKGVTFDTGGISLKPSANMDEMKGDMAGAGVILGVMHALATRQAPVHVVGVVALAENMPSGKAQRPGDIVTSLSGQTIEILNTDAEGRLILADALWYAQSRFQPRYLVDLATLTGAMRVALGTEYAGIFSNCDVLAEQLTQAGDRVGEKLWRLPLGPAYDAEVSSTIADMKNIASAGFGAGSIMGGQFLARFVNQTPWAHVDIAAVDHLGKATPICPKGPTAFGVRLLSRWLETVAQETA